MLRLLIAIGAVDGDSVVVDAVAAAVAVVDDDVVGESDDADALQHGVDGGFAEAADVASVVECCLVMYYSKDRYCCYWGWVMLMK